MQPSNGSFSPTPKLSFIVEVTAEVDTGVRAEVKEEVRAAAAAAAAAEVTELVGIGLSVFAVRPTRSRRRMQGSTYYNARTTPWLLLSLREAS